MSSEIPELPPLTPERMIARVRNRSVRRVKRWHRELRARVGKERRRRKREIEKIRAALDATQLSPQGASFIGDFEGFSATPYNDPAGHATIGFGHLIHLGNVTAADREAWGSISRARGVALLERDADRFERAVRDLVTVRLDQMEFDALVSFAYNVGEGNLASSTLLRKLNNGERAAVPIELSRWIFGAPGQRLEGLVIRRRAEGRLFMGQGYG